MDDVSTKVLTTGDMRARLAARLAPSEPQLFDYENVRPIAVSNSSPDRRQYFCALLPKSKSRCIIMRAPHAQFFVILEKQFTLRKKTCNVARCAVQNMNDNKVVQFRDSRPWLGAPSLSLPLSGLSHENQWPVRALNESEPLLTINSDCRRR